MDVLFVGLGGGIGAIARYVLGRLVQQSVEASFPVGTLVVNVIGCFVIGALAQVGESRNAFTPQTRLFLFTGILGGFTTFSAFGNETVLLAQNGQGLSAALYVALSVVFGLGAVWVGRGAVSALLR